jgi:hypothetical protein
LIMGQAKAQAPASAENDELAKVRNVPGVTDRTSAGVGQVCAIILTLLYSIRHFARNHSAHHAGTRLCADDVAGCPLVDHVPLKASWKTHYVIRSTNPAKRVRAWVARRNSKHCSTSANDAGISADGSPAH